MLHRRSNGDDEFADRFEVDARADSKKWPFALYLRLAAGGGRYAQHEKVALVVGDNAVLEMETFASLRNDDDAWFVEHGHSRR